MEVPSICSLSINEDLLSGDKNHCLRISVSGIKSYNAEFTFQNISKVFNTENFEITNDATFTFTFKNKQLVSMNCVFQTLSLKNVNIDVTYQY